MKNDEITELSFKIADQQKEIARLEKALHLNNKHRKYLQQSNTKLQDALAIHSAGSLGKCEHCGMRAVVLEPNHFYVDVSE